MQRTTPYNTPRCDRGRRISSAGLMAVVALLAGACGFSRPADASLLPLQAQTGVKGEFAYSGFRRDRLTEERGARRYWVEFEKPVDSGGGGHRIQITLQKAPDANVAFRLIRSGHKAGEAANCGGAHCTLDHAGRDGGRYLVEVYGNAGADYTLFVVVRSPDRLRFATAMAAGTGTENTRMDGRKG